MPSVNIDARQIKGLLPGLEPKQVDKPFCQYPQSKNFLIDLKGPMAAWANRIVFYDNLSFPGLSQTFRLLSDVVIATFGAILKYDNSSGRLYPIFEFSDNGTQWPWTMAEVSGMFYFCRRGAGLFQYNPLTGAWVQLTKNVTLNPSSICASQGRLIVMGDNFVQWSALDDGTNLLPSLTTGAGSQGLNIIGGKGYCLGILPTADGWINYTSKGCFKSELSDGPNPFRHYTLPDSKAIVPINPFCFVNDDNTNNIVLTRKGFYISNGGPFQVYEQLFGEWLSHEFITQEMVSIQTLLRLWFNEDQKLLLLSVANAANPTVFYKAFALYLPRDEWGSFDYNHTGFGEFALNDANSGFNFGFIDPNGYFHKFITDTFSEISPIMSTRGNFWQTDFQIPTRMQSVDTDAAATNIFSSLIKISDINEGGFSSFQPGIYDIDFEDPIIDPPNVELLNSDYTSPAYVYDVTLLDYMNVQFTPDVIEDWMTIPDNTSNEDWNAGTDQWFKFSSSIDMAIGEAVEIFLPYVAANNPLNSLIDVGLFRFQEQKYDDELGVSSDVAVGVDAIPGPPILEDYMNEAPPTEDWSAISPDSFEDYGFGYTQITTFQAYMIGTVDGINPWEDQTIQLVKKEDDGNRQYYVGMCTGTHLIFRMTALNTDETFHLKSLDISGNLAGRL